MIEKHELGIYKRRKEGRIIQATGCSLNIVFFPYNFVNFLNSASSAAALVFYLPGVCTHTDTEGKQRKARVQNILKSSGKKQYLMNSLYLKLDFFSRDFACFITFT